MVSVDSTKSNEVASLCTFNISVTLLMYVYYFDCLIGETCQNAHAEVIRKATLGLEKFSGVV